MAIDDFDAYKPLTVASVSGTPTISKAVPVKITSGESTTGTGEIGIDWTNVSSKTDIGIYDESDTLMDYYFESFDNGSSSAVVWVYDSWARDGTEQLQVAYGNGPSDQSVVASTVFDKETNLEAGYLFNESSGDLIDVTSNNNDGTLNAPSQGATGLTDGAYSFDGVDDVVDISGVASQVNSNSTGHISLWVYLDSLSPGQGLFNYFDPDDDASFRNKIDDTGTILLPIEDSGGTNTFLAETDNSVISSDQWYKVDFVQDGTALKIYVNGNSVSWTEKWGGGDDSWLDLTAIDSANIMGNNVMTRYDRYHHFSTSHSSDYVVAGYDSEKTIPDFFSQQSPEKFAVANAIFHGINF